MPTAAQKHDKIWLCVLLAVLGGYASTASSHPSAAELDAELDAELAAIEAAQPGDGDAALLQKALAMGKGIVQLGVLEPRQKALDAARSLVARWPRDSPVWVHARWALAVGLARSGRAQLVEEAGAHFEAANKLPPPSLTRYAATRPGSLEALAGTLGAAASKLSESKVSARPANADTSIAASSTAAAAVTAAAVAKVSPSALAGLADFAEQVVGTDGGGWGVGRCVATCDIDTRGADLDLATFDERYARGGRPLLVPLSAFVGEAAAARAAAWRRDALLERYGESELPVQRTSEVTERQVVEATNGGVARVEREEQLTLRAFADAHMRAPPPPPPPPPPPGGGDGGDGGGDGGGGVDAAETAAAAGEASAAGGAAAGGKASATDSGLDSRYVFTGDALPQLLDAEAASLSGPLGASSEFLAPADFVKLLALGPAGSGTFFHAHTNAVFLLHHGCKRWLLLPPAASHHRNASDAAARSGTAAWLDATRDRALYPMKPLECVQPSGTAMFVPSGWVHMIVNEQHSVGVALEVGDQQMIASFS